MTRTEPHYPTLTPLPMPSYPARKRINTDPPRKHFHMDCGILGALAFYPLPKGTVVAVRFLRSFNVFLVPAPKPDARRLDRW
jgi:hypothetical protein